MTNREDAVARAEEWITGYVHARSSNDPVYIRALFTDTAEYRDWPAT